MRTWRVIGLLSLIVATLGSLNWLFVSVAKYDVIAAVAGTSFGELNTGSRIVYTVIGIAGLALLPWLVQLALGRMSVSEPIRPSQAWRVVGWYSLLLSVLGALNWGFIGVARFDVIGHIAGKTTLGELYAGNRIPFFLIGVAGLVLIPWIAALAQGSASIVERRTVSDVTEVTPSVEDEHRRAA